MTPRSNSKFLSLTGSYEPSAIHQLPDGRFLIVEDEKDHPFSLVAIDPDGDVSSTPLRRGLFEAFDSFWKLDDLEGIVLDRSGNIYAITSHSRDGDGDEKAEGQEGGRHGRRVARDTARPSLPGR